jgi:hypothetical protein
MQDDEDVVVVLVELRAVVARVDVLVVEGLELEVGLQPVPIGGPRRLDLDPADTGRLDDLGATSSVGATGTATPVRRIDGSGEGAEARYSARTHRASRSRLAVPGSGAVQSRMTAIQRGECRRTGARRAAEPTHNRGDRMITARSASPNP